MSKTTRGTKRTASSGSDGYAHGGQQHQQTITRFIRITGEVDRFVESQDPLRFVATRVDHKGVENEFQGTIDRDQTNDDQVVIKSGDFHGPITRDNLAEWRLTRFHVAPMATPKKSTIDFSRLEFLNATPAISKLATKASATAAATRVGEDAAKATARQLEMDESNVDENEEWFDEEGGDEEFEAEEEEDDFSDEDDAGKMINQNKIVQTANSRPGGLKAIPHHQKEDCGQVDRKGSRATAPDRGSRPINSADRVLSTTTMLEPAEDEGPLDQVVVIFENFEASPVDFFNQPLKENVQLLVAYYDEVLRYVSFERKLIHEQQQRGGNNGGRKVAQFFEKQGKNCEVYHANFKIEDRKVEVVGFFSVIHALVAARGYNNLKDIRKKIEAFMTNLKAEWLHYKSMRDDQCSTNLRNEMVTAIRTKGAVSTATSFYNKLKQTTNSSLATKNAAENRVLSVAAGAGVTLDATKDQASRRQREEEESKPVRRRGGRGGRRGGGGNSGQQKQQQSRQQQQNKNNNSQRSSTKTFPPKASAASSGGNEAATSSDSAPAATSGNDKSSSSTKPAARQSG
jgi:hypothetical protein